MKRPLISGQKFVPGTYNKPPHQKNWCEGKGTALIIAFIIMGVLILLGLYFLSFALAESRIAKSQAIGTQTYYLAEAGIYNAIWKLKYDNTTTDGDVPWATCFVTTTVACPNCANWSGTFIKNTSSLIPNSTTTVTIQNSECARGRITATSTISLGGGKTAQRVVKTTVFKSLASPTQGAAVFSGGASENINIDYSKIRVYGDLFSNHQLNIADSRVEVYATSSAEGKILVENIYKVDDGSTVTSTAICAKNICNTTSTCECAVYPEKFQECRATPTPGSCPPKEISTPIVDFDSPATTSFKTRAQNAQNTGQCYSESRKSDGTLASSTNKCVFTSSGFEDFLWTARKNGTITLNTTTTPGIVYVTGQVDLKGGRRLVVNGALVADDTINIGEKYTWTKGGQKDEGFSQITINRPTDKTASGLLTKAKINFGLYSSFTTTTITGVIYANDEIRLTSLPKSFKVRGGIIGRKLAFTSVWQGFEFILDDEIIRYGLGYKIGDQVVHPQYSPIITVEHWEETY